MFQTRPSGHKVKCISPLPPYAWPGYAYADLKRFHSGQEAAKLSKYINLMKENQLQTTPRGKCRVNQASLSRRHQLCNGP